MAAASSAPAASRKVLTVNTHKGFTALNRRFVLHELREAVRTVGADIVFLQEVLGKHVAHQMRFANWPDAPQYEFLAESIWPSYAYGCNAVYPHGHHGNALLSKWPILRHQNHDISASDPEKRGLLHCVLHAPDSGVHLHAICVHLALWDKHRRPQTALLCDLLATEVPSDAPLIVAGDFNDWRLRAHAQLVREAKLREVFVEAFGEPARTFPARWPLLRNDRIYVRNANAHAPMVLPRRPWTHLSDHTPLAAEIDL
ncbi:MAG TPA: endonuclease/exonuclease/phosphatase family protein [Noviherbaspirillum sp.]|nr:endonuclease/exonuclease/phosphatase family protein [Noviherbaspirillum sp.]